MDDRHGVYTALLMRHRNLLWSMCMSRVGGDRDRCQDLLQEVSVALWENMDKLRPNSSARQERAWVCWQARSVFYQVERRQTLPTVSITSSIADSVTDDEALHRKELLDDLLSKLTPDEQQMVRLYLEGYQGDEIGATMGVSRDTVYQRMRRVVHKLRNVALIMLTLLLTSAIAVAVVPEWRHIIFGGGGTDKGSVVTDSLTEKTDDSVPLPDTVSASRVVKKAHMRKKVPVEKMPPLDILEIKDIPEEMVPLVQDGVTLSVDGMRLTITGAQGEFVRVYDMGGMLVAAQVAGSICLIDLYPSTDPYRGGRLEYVLQIGSRPALKVKL